MAGKRGVPNDGQSKWDDAYYLRAYDLARAGATNKSIAEDLGVSHDCFCRWEKKRPALRDAIARGRSQVKVDGSCSLSLRDYVYLRLPPDIQLLWDEVLRIQRERLPMTDTEALLQEQNTQVRQRLYVHALLATCFNPSKACRILCITYQEVMQWLKTDRNFLDLMEEVEWHRANFFEAHLCRAVARGDVQAAIFANKTYNASRGYRDGVKPPLEDTTPEETSRLEELDLPVEVLEKIAEALDRKKSRKHLEAKVVR